MALLSFGLTGCGGDDGAPVAGAPNPNGVTANDKVYSQTIPYLQQQYGNITTGVPITIANGYVLQPGVHSWAQIYSPYILRLVADCNCQAQSYGYGYGYGYGNQNQQAQQQVTGLGGVDFQLFQYRAIGPRENEWSVAGVLLGKGGQGSVATFLWVVHAIMSGGYSYVSQVYPQYDYGYFQPYYPPQNSVSFNYNGQKGGGQFFLGW